VKASFHTDGDEKQRFVAKGSGGDRPKDVSVLEDEVTVQHNRQRVEEHRRPMF
jgi:hypothetical protein